MENLSSRDYLEGSRIVSLLRKLWSKARLLSVDRWQRLRSLPWMREAGEAGRQAPLRAAGLFLTAAVLTNLLLLRVLHKEVPAFGWLLRGALLMAGIAGLRCRGDWESVRKGSALLRILFPRDSG